MLALNVPEIKPFMHKLFMESVFDAFLVRSMEFQTICTFMIEGKLNKDFFTTEEQEALGNRKYAKWEELRDFAFRIIKGNKTPLAFSIVFALSEENTEKVAARCGDKFPASDISGLFLNIKYEAGKLILTSGTSRNTFTMDKTLDYVWEEQLLKFFKHNEIVTEAQA